MNDSPPNSDETTTDERDNQQHSGPVFMTKILLLGSTDVGKKAIVNRLFKEGYGKAYHSKNKRTDFDLAKLDLYLRDELGAPTATVHYEVFSTSAKMNHSHALKKVFQSASYVIFQFDITSRQSFDELNSYMNSYIVLSHRHDVPILVVGNKSDQSAERAVEMEEILAWTSISRTKRNIVYIECSAKTGHGIADITSHLLARYQEKQEKINRRARVALSAQWSKGGIAHMSSSMDSTDPSGETTTDDSRNLGILNPNIHGTDDDEEEERRRNRWSDFELKMAISLSDDLQETDSGGDGGENNGENGDSFDKNAILVGRPELRKSRSNASRNSDDDRSQASGSTGMTSVDRRSIRSNHSSNSGSSSGNSQGALHALLRSGTRPLAPTDLTEIQNVIESSYVDADTRGYHGGGGSGGHKKNRYDPLTRQPTDKTMASELGEEFDYLYDADEFLFEGSGDQRFDGYQSHRHYQHQRQAYQRQYDQEKGCVDVFTCGLFNWEIERVGGMQFSS